MKYFKTFKIFEANEPVKDQSKEEEVKDASKDVPSADAKKDAPSTTINVVFKNTFNYDQIKINDSFNKTIDEALAQLEEFMKNENKDNILEVIYVNATGIASWVPTKYKGGNNQLAKDRGTSVVVEVKKRLKQYFDNKGIKAIKFVDSEIEGKVDEVKSKEIFVKFIEENYKSDVKKLITDLNAKGLIEIDLVKESKEKYSVKTVNQLKASKPDEVITLKVEAKNAQQIYDLMVKSPLYIRGTSKIGNIESLYRDASQLANVEIVINDPDLRNTDKEKPKEEKPKETANLKSISFNKDTAVPDAAGEEAIKLLIEYLNNVKPDDVESLIVIGHAEADDELNKKVFDANIKAVLKGKSGNDTVMTEAELANLRFILSMARCKTIFSRIKDLTNFANILNSKKFWMLPAGTIYGDKLQNQRIVQLVVIKTNGNQINTEEKAVPFGPAFKGSSVVVNVNKLMTDIGYSFSKIIPKLIGIQSYGTPVPSHLELAASPEKLANFKKEYM
jgi:outer membrane protein OmpA-like peptidoglycan-associated protein